jgi:hypothetical protein
LATTPRGDLEDLRAQQALGFDRRLGVIAEMDVPGDGELHERSRPIQLDGLDVAHLETRNLHALTGCQAAGIREVSRVLPALEERQPVVVQRAQHNADRQGQPDSTDDELISFREGLQFGAHLPVDWPATLTYTG